MCSVDDIGLEFRVDTFLSSMAWHDMGLRVSL